MYMAEGLDTGDMLLTEKTEIGADETAGELHDRLSVLGSQLIVKTLEAIENGTAKRIPQTEENTCYASMLTKELSRIDWSKPANTIHDLVRGLSPWPVASTVYRGKILKIYQTKIVEGISGNVGQVFVDGNFVVCCGSGTAVELAQVQYEGGKRMSGKDFLRGHPADDGMILE
jgi:methionyl-tRNA formyltransferase